jgi:hypothetical protein
MDRIIGAVIELTATLALIPVMNLLAQVARRNYRSKTLFQRLKV